MSLHLPIVQKLKPEYSTSRWCPSEPGKAEYQLGGGASALSSCQFTHLAHREQDYENYVNFGFTLGANVSPLNESHVCRPANLYSLLSESDRLKAWWYPTSDSHQYILVQACRPVDRPATVPLIKSLSFPRCKERPFCRFRFDITGK